MTKLIRSGIPLAVLGLAALAVPLSGTAAASTTASSYQATLNPLNHATASGDFMMSLSGTTATITEHVTGLAATFGGAAYPHVQHIHIGAKGDCPTTAADKNGDGVISTTEGAPPTAASARPCRPRATPARPPAPTSRRRPRWRRTTTSAPSPLDAATVASLKGGTAVIVVHGLDPAKLGAAQGEKSDLVPSLPLAATSPALCGKVDRLPDDQHADRLQPTGGGSLPGSPLHVRVPSRQGPESCRSATLLAGLRTS